MNKILIIVLSLSFLSSCATTPEKTPEENYIAFLKYFRNNDIDGAKKHFEDNRKYGPGNGPYYIEIQPPQNIDQKPWRHEYKLNREITWKEIISRFSYDKMYLSNFINDCKTIDKNNMDKCRDFFSDTICEEREKEWYKNKRDKACLIIKDIVPNTSFFKIIPENKGNIFVDEWAPQELVDNAYSIFPNFVNAYNKIQTERLLEIEKSSKEIQKTRDNQTRLCKKNHIKYAVSAIVRIEGKYKNGFLAARLVSVNNYLCGEYESINWLPKIFVLKDFKNSKDFQCSTIMIKGSKVIKLPDTQGIIKDWMIWEMMPKSQIVKSYYREPNWYPCQFF